MSVELAFRGRHADRWEREALERAVPGPEGFDAAPLLRELMPSGDVLDYGCGFGRHAPVFSPKHYVGVDVCADAIAFAREQHPEYRFERCPAVVQSKFAGVLLYTVLLHFVDDELDAALQELVRVDPDRVLVVEPLGRERRSTYAFHRERDDYEAAFSAFGYALERVVEMPYIRYPGACMSFLLFRGKS